MFTNFNPFPTLHTERLTLRQLVATDAPEMLVLRSDPRVLTFLEIVPARTLEDVRPVMQRVEASMAEGTSVFWAIALQDRPKLIGTICLWNLSEEKSTAEIGYMLH
ncbi:MAG: GNAT family N-acetyltransferase, partial [Saprospiraceae bacterium]|nr:GNAT family N-acetyltransferase [Saprospiraceae bacterium]